MAIILNTCIVAINSKRVKTGTKLNLGELIQLVMGLGNITMRCSSAAQIIISTFWPTYITVRELSSTIIFLHLFHMCFSFWLTACLCGYYCTSIIISNHRLFIWTKKILSSQMPLLLLLSGIGSFLLTFPLTFSLQIKSQQQDSGNSTSIVWVMSYNVYLQQLLNIVGCFLPSFCIFLSMISTVLSLVRHIQRMRNNEMGFASPKLHAHTSAIRTMLLFLTLSVVFYVCETLLYVEHGFDDPMTFIKLLIVTIFPTAEAAIIIQASPQLQITILGWFCRVKSHNNDT
uniref:Taste receptor type 2 n=2 Tax=Pyxicephalus adspersus TaxID=30357 RepID=A0AAV2ZLM6_PYXAD|nr:TPA: hypothetical protein GDO54_014780 [Pyxicephalus adspersus]